MEIQQRNSGDVEIIAIEGEIDLYNAPEIKKLVQKMISEGKVKVIIDFDKVSYIDSSGIGAMISSLSNLKKQGGMLKILNIHDSVKKVFELTKLTSFFKIFQDEQEAVDSFA